MNPKGDTLEATGSWLVRKVLASGGPEMVDLRAQRGVGIDAVDELLQFYALKVFGGEEPDEIRLTQDEARRALGNADFFLVIISGVADGPIEPTVKVITGPLERLRKLYDGGMRLGGVRSAHSLVYRLATINEKYGTGPISQVVHPS